MGETLEGLRAVSTVFVPDNNRQFGQKGLTLTEILIAGVLIALLVAGALMGLKGTVGFVTRTGRFTQTMPYALELGERDRDRVRPGYTVNAVSPEPVDLMQIPGTRELTVVKDPCETTGECKSGVDDGPVDQINRIQIKVLWNEPKN